jgi:hypothetical protein
LTWKITHPSEQSVKSKILSLPKIKNHGMSLDFRHSNDFFRLVFIKLLVEEMSLDDSNQFFNLRL